jgi:polysaccharide export outer membrane protein
MKIAKLCRSSGILLSCRRTVRSAGILLILLILVGCAQGESLPKLNDPTSESYYLGVGDQVRVITYDEAQLSNDFTVGADGMIAFPLLGTVRASGLTADQLATLISASLEKNRLISQPSVSVQIVEYRPISVLGEVNHPAQYPYQPGMTMLDAVALAGGFTYRAVTDHASDWRSNNKLAGQAMEGDIGPGTSLEPGDVITVYERYF